MGEGGLFAQIQVGRDEQRIVRNHGLNFRADLIKQFVHVRIEAEYHVKAQPISLHVRLRPLYRVAAFLAFAVVIGSAVEFSTGSRTESTQEQVAVQEQDELDVDEAKPLDIRSAELMTSDTLHIQ